MAWEDNLREASYRDVVFFTESHGADIGRRRARHVYPRRDLPFHEDLGRQPRVYSVEAFVLGDQYFAARDALIRACETEGPGTLIHPYFGELTVICSACRARESNAEGRMARLSLTFEEAGELRFPAAEADTQSLVEGAADDASIDVQGAFEEAFTVDGALDFVVVAARDLVSESLSEITGGAGRLVTDAGSWNGFVGEVSDTGADLVGLLREPRSLASRFSKVICLLLDTVDSPDLAVPLLRRLSIFGEDLGVVPPTTASRRQQASNQAAVAALIRQTATVESARAAARVDFQSFDDAIAYREDLAELFDRETLAAGAAGQDDVFRGLVQLQAAAIQDLNRRALGLPRVRFVEPRKTEPALAVAYRLYGDPTRSEEIVARNRVAHPGFVPGGAELRILSA